MTVKKPGNGIKHENLQKSATTNSNTVQVNFNGPHFTPKDKVPKNYDADDFSEKFTPECANAPLSQAMHNAATNAPSKKGGEHLDDSTSPALTPVIAQKRTQKQASKE